MTAKAHQPLRDYVGAIRGIIDREDAFGQNLNRLVYRESRYGAAGLFRHVRALHDAVIAAGGTLPDARSWTSQAIRWMRTGKAVEHKHARFEVDRRAAAAMDALLKLLQSLPEEMLNTTAPGTPLPRPTFPSAPPAKPPTPAAPSTPPQSLFGSHPRPTTTPATTPLGATNRPGTSPAFGRSLGSGGFGQASAPTPAPRPAFPPQPPRPNPFGSRPGSPFGTQETLPYHINLCFEALAVVPDPLKPEISANQIPDWLSTTVDQVAADQIAQQELLQETLPTNLKGLFELWHKHGSNKEAANRILAAIGQLDDLRAIDYFYKLAKHSETPVNLMEVFVKVGGNVGIAGLLTMLPIANNVRHNWLTALYNIVQNSIDQSTADQQSALSETTQDLIWQIAITESASRVTFCPAAYDLLAALGRPEAASQLWSIAGNPFMRDANRQRAILYALARVPPGDWLSQMLIMIGNMSDSVPPASPFSQTIPSPSHIRIPFEALRDHLSTGVASEMAGALFLIGYLNDPRVVPLLAEQLSRRVPRLRETALAHLRRLKATTAANSVARLMEKDESLRQKAAEILYEWHDARCVPLLLQALPAEASDKPEKTIRYLGKLSHPAFDNWLMKAVDLLEQRVSETEDALVEVISVLAEIESPCLQPVVEKLLKSKSLKVRISIATALGKFCIQLQTKPQPLAERLPDAAAIAWALNAIYGLLLDTSPVVSYQTATVCHSSNFAHRLIANGNEVKRMLGVRWLWAAKDVDGLRQCMGDPSTAIRDLAIWALASLQQPDTVDELWDLVEQEDRIDLWNQNPAVSAWRGLAKLGMTTKRRSAALEADAVR